MSEATSARRVRWSDVEADDPLPLVRRRRIVGEHAMLSRFELGAGCVVPSHSHANEQLACVLSGRVRFVVGDASQPDGERELVLGAGEVLHLPPWVPHAAHGVEDAVVLDVFAPPSESTGVDAAGG